MRVGTLVELTLLGALAGCGSGQTPVGSSVGQTVSDEVEASAAEPDAGGAAGAGGESADAGAATEPEPPPPDPALIKALVDKTGESTPLDNPLHLRLEVLPRPAGERWLLAVVNRGTQPANVLFDLRRLTLSLSLPEDPSKPRPKWKKKPAPVICKLPQGFGGTATKEEEPRLLAPGEGLLQTFDPRLYCISAKGESLLSAGQTATARLGFTPKPPRVVWKQGKRTELPSLQSAPFVAQPAADPAAAVPEAKLEIDPEHDLRVKELSATPIELTPDLFAGEAEEDPTLPLTLSVLRGSDASSERTATATVEVRAKGKKVQIYFRRELVSFTVHGPEGISTCDPQPDDRAPDRQAYSTLATGQAISATGLLTELCPNLTFGRPGLYLVSARLDAVRDGAEFGLKAFTGRLESRRQAQVRIRAGDLPELPPPEPLRVRVGQ